MTHHQQIEAWGMVSTDLLNLTNSGSNLWQDEYEMVTKQAEMANPWFTRKSIDTSLQGIAAILNTEQLKRWAEKYPENENSPKKIGVIMAGNIPLAGFHDLLCVLMSGNILSAKLSSSDKYLLPFIAKIFFYYAGEMDKRLIITENLKNVDAVIATGSNNTSRYFEYYFGKLPHIFRKNRNSAAVISGTENEYDFILLGRDIFTYFGLGCRNVSKVFVPGGYKFDDFFQNIVQYNEVMQHTKYMNNFDYHQTLYLLNRQHFLTNNFLIVIEDNAVASPVGVLHYETYSNEVDLQKKIEAFSSNLQCVVSKSGPVLPGQAQFPQVTDYADGVDTMEFLANIGNKVHG